MEGKDQLQTEITTLRETLKSLGGKLRAQEKALSALATSTRDEDLPRMSEALARLDPELFRRVGAEGLAALRETTRATLDGLRSAQRRELTRGLRTACAEARRDFQMLTENPPEYRIPPFSARLDTHTMEVTLLYSRQEICQVAARPEAILEAAARAEKDLTARQDTPEQLFTLMLQAYRAVLGILGRAPGERVELADLLPQLALARQGRGFVQDPSPQRFRPYPRSRFLFDLARLRAARLLEQGGVRMDLGTATGDSVKRKSRVFYLEGPDGQGQYYLSVRFVPVRG